MKATGGVVPLEDWAKAIDDDTAVVSVDYVSWFSGCRERIKEISEIAHGHGALLFVDGFHGIGVFPIDAKRDGIDALFGGFYKWLCGPHGAACVWVREDALPGLEPSYIGWHGIKDNVIERMRQNRDVFDVPFPIDSAPPAADAARFEWGTWAAVVVRGAIEAVKFAQTYDPASRFSAISKRREEVMSGLQALGKKLLTPATKPGWRDRLDRIATHRVWGYLVLVLIMAVFFQAVFRFGQMGEDFFTSYLDWALKLTQNWFGADSLGYYLLGEGLFMGIFGGVAIVLPYLVPFLVGLALLEDSGYLPRVAFLMDNLMHRLGLHGKSIIPFILGYGCSVPAVMATRIMESPRDRFVVSLLAVLIPCSARSVIIFALVAYVIGPWWALGVYFFNLVVIAVLGRLSTWILPEVSPGLIMEIPEYRRPTLKTVLQKSWRNLKDFIVVAWPILIVGSVVLSLLKYYKLEALLNEALVPLTALLGLPTAVGTTLIFGIMRKELSLIMLNEALGTTQLSTVLSHTQLLTFTVFVLFYIPCASTIAALGREIGWRGAAAAVLSSLAIALGLGVLTRAFGLLIF
jgi:ferrous iron transport protein B